MTPLFTAPGTEQVWVLPPQRNRPFTHLDLFPGLKAIWLSMDIEKP